MNFNREVDLINLSGKKIVIAGASSGIGRRTAIALSREGAKVVLLARREEKLQEVLGELDGSGHSYYATDLSELDAIADLFRQIYDQHGKMDGMVYAAGIGNNIPLMQIKSDMLKRMFDINFFGFVECVRQICRRGRFNDGMRIVGISSIASFIGEKSHIAYASSKGAMNTAIKGMAHELAGKGICINAVAPGWVDTEMYREAEGAAIDLDSSWDRQYMGLIKEEDVASAICFLLSPAAHYITGVILPVDGGYTSS